MTKGIFDVKTKNTLQINYWTLGGFEGKTAVEQALQDAKNIGFEGMELCFGAGEFSPGISEKRCREIRAAAGKMGMKIETAASGNYWNKSLTAPAKTERKEALAFSREYLQAAARVGAKTALVIPGAVAVPWVNTAPIVSYKDAWKYATEAIRALVPTAKKCGVRIGIENVWNWFLTDPMAMKTFLDQFDGKWVGAYFDAGNCLINGFAEHWIEILGKRILAVHLKNFSRDDCGGTLHGFGDDIMKGSLDWNAALKALEQIGYNGPLTAEMIPFSRLPNLVLPDMTLARDTGKKLIGLLKR